MVREGIDGDGGEETPRTFIWMIPEASGECPFSLFLIFFIFLYKKVLMGSDGESELFLSFLFSLELIGS